MAELPNVTIQDTELLFPNFSGRETQFNAEGTKVFGVLLEPDLALAMMRDGWNVKKLKPRNDEDTDERYSIQVTVSYKYKAPKIIMITQDGRTPLDEETVNMLDWADIKTVDVVLRPREWEVRGQTGIKAYLKTMFVTIEEDELERKYSLAAKHSHASDELD